MAVNDWSKILGWPGYRVYQHEIDEEHKRLKLWVRRKRGNQVMVCSACGKRVREIHSVYERVVRDIACFEYRTTVVVEMCRIRCSHCGVKVERVEQLPSKAPYSKRFEDEVGRSCESAAARQVAYRTGLAESTVRAMDLHYLERWEARRRRGGVFRKSLPGLVKQRILAMTNGFLQCPLHNVVIQWCSRLPQKQRQLLPMIEQ